MGKPFYTSFFPELSLFQLFNILLVYSFDLSLLLNQASQNWPFKMHPVKSLPFRRKESELNKLVSIIFQLLADHITSTAHKNSLPWLGWRDGNFSRIFFKI